MSARLWLAALGLCMSLSTGVMAEDERLDQEFFNRKIISSYNLKFSDATIEEWQKIEIAFKPDDGAVPELYFPVRYILRNAIPSTAHHGGFEVQSMQVTLGRHTSYFRLIYGVRLTLMPLEKPDQGSQKPLYGIASFVGKRSPDFLHSQEAKKAISMAIAECLSRLQPAN